MADTDDPEPLCRLCRRAYAAHTSACPLHADFPEPDHLIRARQRRAEWAERHAAAPGRATMRGDLKGG